MTQQTNTEAAPLKSPLQAYWYATNPVRLHIGLMYVCIILGNACAYSIPYFLKLIVDQVASTSSASPLFSDFLPTILLASTVIIGQEVFYRIGHLFEVVSVVRMYDRITSRLYQQLLERPAAYFEEQFSGKLSRRVEQVGTAFKFFTEFFPWHFGWPIVAIVITITLLSTAHSLLVWTLLAWITLFVGTSYFVLRRQFIAAQAVTAKQASLSGTIVDTLSNAPLVQAFAAQTHEYTHYRHYMDETLTAESRERWLGVFNRLHQGVSLVILSIALIVMSVYLFTQGNITIGDFVLIAATIPTFTAITWSVGDTTLQFVRHYGEAKDALAGLDTEIAQVTTSDTTLDTTNPTIQLRSVSFAYPNSDEKALDDFSLDIKSGEKVGVVGHSGAGKSTLVKLLLHSYDPQTGSIHIGDTDITTVSLHSLRNAISFVPQDTALFHRTLFENILYARPDATKEEVVAASKTAHAHDFIEKYPDGYDTLVGERGVKLSGGQRQRIALARAMLKNAPILVLDEATSALDSESEEVVQKGLDELFKDKTVVAIAHRLSTLRSMDRVVVIENGAIVESGAPQELLTKDSIFKDLWEHQKRGFI